MSTNNKIAKIDQELEAEKEAIRINVRDKDEQERQIAELDDKADTKKKELMRKQAKRDKGSAIFAATVNTAQAITKAFAQLGPIAGAIAAAIVGGFGAVQISLIASQPLPALAGGALIKKRTGGHDVTVAEGTDDEAILPMRKATDELTTGIVNKMNDMYRSNLRNNRIHKKLSKSQKRSVHNHWHIGALIADKGGIKKLERMQYKYRVLDEQRKGI